MRQVGKTTLMKSLFENIKSSAKLWFDFDNSLDQKIFEDIEYKNIYLSLRDLAKINMLSDINKSQSFENAVINQLQSYGKVSFYNKSNASEIDAISDNKIAFEIKINGTEQDIKKTAKIAQTLDISNSYVISKKYSKLKKTVFAEFF